MTGILLSHGGVGAKAEWSDGCEKACAAGLASLNDGDALGAVVETGKVLEDDERFNAGTGANLRLEGLCQMDASVMTDEGRFGAVACISGVQYPIEVARLVMDETPHLMLCGDGATAFARMKGIAPYSPVTQRAMEKLARHRQKLADHPLSKLWGLRARFKGTIGAVARTASGRFAVSCSTGGTALMLKGRVGDSPILGAGVFAGEAGAICCTGDGEDIMRRLVAHRIYLKIEAGADLEEACQAELDAFPEGGYLGIIAVSRDSHCLISTHPMPCFALEI